MNVRSSHSRARFLSVLVLSVLLLSLMPTAFADPIPPPGAYTENIAYNPTGTGYPSPLESTPGWGGGARPWDILDGHTYYTDTWAHGLAFTGGIPGYLAPCGWRQATVNFGEMKTFDAARIWHHGRQHIPITYWLEYWDGAVWSPIAATSTLRMDLETTIGWGSAPTDHVFAPVTGSKIRFNVNNCDMEHGWLYEFEVFGVMPVGIDVKPGEPDNVISLGARGKAPVAVLSDEEFNAPEQVDRASLTFGRTGDEKSLLLRKDKKANCYVADVNDDKHEDLVCYFLVKYSGFQEGDKEGVLKGTTVAGAPFEGRDIVNVVP